MTIIELLLHKTMITLAFFYLMTSLSGNMKKDFIDLFILIDIPFHDQLW